MDGKSIIIDQEFWNDFILEAFEHIEEIETNVLTLEQNPEDMDIIHTMFRAFHTIKGLSGFVEHSIIQEIAHKTETMMDFCRKGELKVNTPIVDAILKSSDYIKRLCEDVDSCKDDSFIAILEKHIEWLEELSAIGDEPEVKPEIHVVEEETLPQEQELQVEEASQDEPEISIPFDFELEAKEAETTQDIHVEIEELPKEELPVEEISASEVENIEQNEEEALKPEEADKSEPKVRIPVVKSGKTKSKKEEKADLSDEKYAISEAQPEQKLEMKEEIKVEQKPAMNQTARVEPKAVEPQKVQTATVMANAPEEHMKVANSKIDHLVDMIGELIISQSLIEGYVAKKYSHDNQLSTNMSSFLRITRELQGLSMSLRMVSLKPTFQKITRIARDTIQELGKEVEFVSSGEGTEIDRVVTDKLLDPLVHMIKNAISHGVEKTAEDRLKMGKSRRARVELNAFNKRGKIFIEVKDDGRGIDTEVVYKKALEKGLINAGDVYTEEEIKEFILLPGFSTAEKVDNISGRGVGMDVVKTQILKIGGKVEIKSELHKGSTFTLEVPVNHAIMNGTVVELCGEQFIIPTINVKEILQPKDEQWIFTQQKRTMLRVREDIIPIVPLSTIFKKSQISEKVPLVILVELDGEFRALPIDNVINRQEVVVKPVGEEFSHLKFISGMSILGTGKVSLILDIDYLFKKEVKE